MSGAFLLQLGHLASLEEFVNLFGTALANAVDLRLTFTETLRVVCGDLVVEVLDGVGHFFVGPPCERRRRR